MTFEGFSRRPMSPPDERDGTDFALDPADAVEDSHLVARVADGDGPAFEALDAAQEVFVRLFTRADKYHPSGSFRAWLFRIATNVAIDAIRSRRRRFFGWSRRQKRPSEQARPLTDDLATLPDPGSGALDGLIDRERASIVRQAVQTLPARYRAALVLRDLQDLSYEEVADVLGIRVGTVKSRVNRARNLRREKLAPHVGDGA